ncbi:MAG: UDP-N-acetylmuramate--L-alanine ligase [Nitrospina sp.]|nr:UDP-N-acetylmuramate--L-alanine ligase [Nitrospina sp.]
MFLGKTKRIHFIGIGGSGMSGIAEVLINLDYEVTGSDLSRTPLTGRLERLGAKVLYGHDAAHVAESQVVVTSSAVKADNPEVLEARRRMIPVIPRAEMLAELMRMKHGIAIAGTHGKTTTTSLVATVLAGGHLDPTVVIGGRLKSVDSHAKMGTSEFLVVEADESDGSFLKLFPTIAVVTTLDEEHMDFYGTLDNMKAAFLDFLNRLPFYGTSVLCLDDANIQSLIPKLEKRHITYGLTSQADYTARGIEIQGLDTWFNVFHHGEELGRIHSVAPGRHNVLNTLAAVAVGMELNLSFEAVATALKDFRGVKRRFEIIHQSEELIVVDDYGHHPAEIQATLRTAKEVWPNRRLVVVFQPHRYSRTQHLLDQFCSAFNDADQLLVLDIYPAGEEAIPGISGSRVADGVMEYGHKDVHHLPTIRDALDHLFQNLQPGDVVMTLGAGNVWELEQDLLANLPTALGRGTPEKDTR